MGAFPPQGRVSDDLHSGALLGGDHQLVLMSDERFERKVGYVACVLLLARSSRREGRQYFRGFVEFLHGGGEMGDLPCNMDAL